MAKSSLVLFFTYTGDTTCGVWFDLDSSKTQSITTTIKIHFSRNSRISVWKPNFFRRQAIAKILFFSDSSYTGDTLFRVWFNLNIYLTQSKITIVKIRQKRSSQLSYENPTFLLGKLYKKFFLFYTLITLVILHAEVSLVWTAPWPDQTDLFLKFLILETQKHPYEIRMKYLFLY